jgi:hypothetical protein
MLRECRSANVQFMDVSTPWGCTLCLVQALVVLYPVLDAMVVLRSRLHYGRHLQLASMPSTPSLNGPSLNFIK